MMNKRLGWILAITATVAYSTNAPFARGAILAGMHPMTLLAARFFLASSLYWIALGSFSVGSRPAERGNEPEKRLDRFGLSIAIGSGLINGLVLVCFFMALRSVSTAIYSMSSVTLVQIFTLGVLTVSGEAITRRKMIRLGLSVVGLYLLIGLGGDYDQTGMFLIVLGSLFFALHIASVQWFLASYNTWTITTLIVTAATVSTLVLWLFTGSERFIPWPLGWIAILFQGIITTFIGRLITYRAIGIIGSGQYALLAPLETTLTLIWAALFLQEWLTNLQWLGAVFVLAGVFLASDLVWEKIRLTM